MNRRDFFKYTTSLLFSITACGIDRKSIEFKDGLNTPQKITIPKKVIIVGGGLSGLTAGIHLIERGFEVEIFEKSSVCGGKLSSFKERHLGCDISLEHGFHVWWGQYYNFIDMMKRLNIKRHLKEIHSIEIKVKGCANETIGFSPKVYPFFLLFPLLFSRNISFREIMKSGTIGLLILGYDKKRYDKWFDKISFNDLMKEYDTPENIQKVFFEPFLQAGFFAEPHEISAASFLELFHFYLSGNIRDFKCYHIGGNPQEKVIEPTVKYFLDRGGRVNFNSEIENLIIDNYKVKGIQQKSNDIHVYRDGEVIHILQTAPLERSIFKRSMPVQEIPEDNYIKVELPQNQTIFIGFFNGEIIALSGECTHAGCLLNWDYKEGRFICPCHGGQFSRDGYPLKGPPLIALSRFKIGENVKEPSYEHAVSQQVVHSADYFIIATDIPGVQGIANNIMMSVDEWQKDEFHKILNLKTSSCIVLRIWFNKSLEPDRLPVGFTSGFKFIIVYFILSQLNDDVKECSRKTDTQCIEFIIIKTPDMINLSDAKLLELVTPEIVEIFPEIKDTPMIDFSIMRHDNYTFFNKGAVNLRPHVQSSIFINLFYSGDWVYLDAPVFFMEKAVMTAKIAVNHILLKEGIAPNPIYLPNVRGILS